MKVNGRTTAWRGLASYKDPTSGKQRRKSVTRPTRREAERALKEVIAKLPRCAPQAVSERRTITLPPSSGDHTVLAYLHRWLAFKARDLRATSYRSYTQELNAIAPHLGALNFSELSTLDVEHALQAMLLESCPPHLAARSLRTLRMALRQAVRWGLVDRNVAEYVRAPRVSPAKMQVWTAEEAARFLVAAEGHRLYPLFCLALSTGMRKGELLALRWMDVDFERSELSVCYGLIRDLNGTWVLGEPKTQASRRTISLPEDVMQVLREHRREERRWAESFNREQPVFAVSSGNRYEPSHVSRVFRKITVSAGLPRIRFHDLRHTAASLLIRQGVPAKLVSDRLGHTDIAFTLRVYTHLYDDQRREAALPLTQLLSSHSSARASSVNSLVLPRDQHDVLEQLRQVLSHLTELLPPGAAVKEALGVAMAANANKE